MSPVFLIVALVASAEPDGGAVAADAGPEPAPEAAAATPPAADAGTPPAPVSTLHALGEESQDFSVRVRAGFITEWGSQPGGTLGASVGVRLGGPRWSALVEAWTLFPSVLADLSNGVPAGSVNTWSVGGLAGPCYELPVLSGSLLGCALGRAGALLAEPRNLDPAKPAWLPTVAAGLRVGAEWPRASFLAFYLTAQAFVPLLRALVVGGGLDWGQGWVHGGGQVGLRVRFR